MNTDGSFLTLLQICDSIFPIGSYTQSNGLETYVQLDLVNDFTTAVEYVKNMLLYNIKYGDALAVSLAYKAALSGNLELITEIDNRLWASKSAREIKDGSCKLCMRFLKLVLEFGEYSVIKDYMRLIENGQCFGQYSAAFGVFAADSRIPLEDVLTAFVYNQASGMVVNCAKLIPLGQIDGQKILFKMQSVIKEAVSEIKGLNINDLGRCCMGFEIRAMQHEDLYSRLYMS